MITQKDIRMIRTMNTSFSVQYIHEVDAQWKDITERIKRSGKDLSKIQIVPEGE